VQPFSLSRGPSSGSDTGYRKILTGRSPRLDTMRLTGSLPFAHPALLWIAFVRLTGGVDMQLSGQRAQPAKTVHRAVCPRHL